uniref:Uncharacterized protein n=1 Tax=Rhizophora mucronata TaxID=61149 RepID=A0A2P2PJR9_RHIMU
MTKQGLAAH